MNLVARIAGVLALLIAASFAAFGQAMPATVGETVNGQPITLADLTRGRASILIAGFSREAGAGADEWARLAHADPALGAVEVYEAAMLERAPGFVRSMIKSSLRHQLSPAAQARFAILSKDEALWRSYFGVTSDKDPWVVYLSADGRILWHGHGAARDLEPLLAAAGGAVGR